MISYPTIYTCRAHLFPYIRTRMAVREPVPWYEGETSGLHYLESIFQLMKRSEYRDILDKAAYLFCSIIDGHHFSNGNKRLAVTLLVFFLTENGYAFSSRRLGWLRRALKDAFPSLRWQRVRSFARPIEHFLYHLAIVIADREQKGNISFREEQRLVRGLLEFATRRVRRSKR